MPSRNMNHASYKKQGFTLVELAIVMTIIGLLIGGVLKGQELLENARVTRQVTQLKGYQTAVTTFRDIYKALPGDMISPGNFLPSCTASPCNTSGNADGVIGGVMTAINSCPPTDGNTKEGRTFWLHLAKADLITGGIDSSGTWTSAGACNSGTWGIEAPASPIGGGTLVGSYAANTGNFNFSGNYFMLIYNTTLSNLSDKTVMSPRQAWQIDGKMDDGLPQTGSVLNFYQGLCSTNNQYNVSASITNAAGKGCNLLVSFSA